MLVGGGAKEEQQRLNLSGTLCRPSIRLITIKRACNSHRKKREHNIGELFATAKQRKTSQVSSQAKFRKIRK